MIIDSIGSLIVLDVPHDVKVISFDIFDTILIRKVDPPEKTKELSCQKAVRDGVINGLSTDLLALRKKTEEGLKKQSLLHGKDREFSIDDAFTEMVSDLQKTNTKEIVSKLLAIEVETERAVLAPMPGIKDILDSFSQKIPLVATSDTYLTTDMLSEIMEHFRIGKYFKKIYASSSYKLSKSSGNLFKCILDEENIRHHELLHIGDNFLSDYFIPKKKGIHAVYLNDKWNFSRKQTLQLMNKLEPKSDFWSNYAQVIRLSSVRKPAGLLNDELYNFGYGFISPLITIFTHLLFAEVRKQGINNIFFIARDGFILKRIFNLFADAFVTDRERFNLHYLCISRYAAVLASVDKLTEREWRYTTRLAVAVKDVLRRLGVAIEDAASLLNSYHLSPESKIAENNTTESLRKLFNDKKFSELVLEKTAPMKARLYQYLVQRDFMKSENIALVDIGWRGVSQDCLEYTFAHSKGFPEIHGYYLGLNPPVLPTQSIRYGLLYDYRNTYPEEMFISFFKEVLELTCKAFHGTTVDYAESPTGRIIPVFNKASSDGTREAKSNLNILQIQRGIIDFTKDYLSFCKIHDNNPYELKFAVVKLYDHLVSLPLKEHIEAMNKIIYTEDFGTSRVRPIIRQFGYIDMFNPKEFTKNLLENPWREASLENSGLSVINFLYSFAKRVVCFNRIIKNANA